MNPYKLEASDSSFERDDLYKILERIDLWTGNCDAKTSVVISAIGVVFALLLSKDYASKCLFIVLTIARVGGLSSWLYLCGTSISILMICLGCYSLFRVLVPITKVNTTTPKSLFFFSSVAQINSFPEFRNRIEKSSESMLREDLLSQIYTCSRICDQKFNNYKRGIIFTLLGTVLFLFMVIIGLISIP